MSFSLVNLNAHVTTLLPFHQNRVILGERFSKIIPAGAIAWKRSYLDQFFDLFWEITVGRLLLDEGFEAPEMLPDIALVRNCEWKAQRAGETWVIEAKNIHMSDDQRAIFDRQDLTGNLEVHSVPDHHVSEDETQNPLIKKALSTLTVAVRQFETASERYAAIGKRIYLNVALDAGAWIQKEKVWPLFGNILDRHASQGIELRVYTQYNAQLIVTP